MWLVGWLDTQLLCGKIVGRIKLLLATNVAFEQWHIVSDKFEKCP